MKHLCVNLTIGADDVVMRGIWLLAGIPVDLETGRITSGTWMREQRGLELHVWWIP